MADPKIAAEGYNFEVTGDFDIDPALKPYEAADGGIIGFTRPDGSIVRLTVALEVERPDGTFQYVNDDRGMEALGFGMLDYSRADFMKR